ncbi:protein transport protein sec16 [Favolaschia claudopus]|uniref:Protein transport protein sec16 n=1 Tax=Favolaschia claudopus TaxID=2862362 RepID=A0AAW0B4W9_9AGAR
MTSAEAEAAASLFGTDESASDLFASLGTETSSRGVFDTPSDSQFSDNSPSFDVFSTEDPHSRQDTSWTEFSQSTQQSSSYPSNVGGAGGIPPLPASNHSTDTGAEYQTQTPQLASVFNEVEQQNTTQAAASNPYVPPVSYNPPAAMPISRSTPPNPLAQPVHNPYAPTATTNAYTQPLVAPPTPSKSSYSPYTPSTPSATSTHPSPYNGSGGGSSFSPHKVGVVPPPPAPAPVLNRPKLANAYDPPIPASRPSRRGVSGPARPISAYGSYSQPPAPTPPSPVPASSQYTASGYALPPLPSAPATNNRPAPQNHSSATGAGLPPPPRPLSSNYAPSIGLASQPSPESVPHTNYGHSPPQTALERSSSPAKLERSMSPAKSSGLRSHSNSLSSQTSSSSTGPSIFPSPPLPDQSVSPTNTAVNASPYTNGSAVPTPIAPPRTASPSSHSLDRTKGPTSLTPDPHVPNAATRRAPSPLRKSTLSSYDPPKPFVVTNGYGVEVAGQTLSPLSNGLQSSQSQYLPGAKPPSLARNRSASSGSVYSVGSSSPEQQYGPAHHGHGTQKRSETDYGNYTSRYNYNAPGEISPYDQPASQEIVMKPVQATAYAPSPSLLGANDPLGRTSSRAPVFSFGFGGKFLTCFHGASMNTGFDVALSSRNSTGITIRPLNKLIPHSALEVSSPSFPGPLFSDPGTPTTGLVRTTTASAQSKAKKARLIKYLTDRAEEISQGINYLHSESTEGRSAEGKLVLVKLLKVLVENDGKLSGTPQIDSAVRAALVTKLDATSSASDGFQAPGFSAVASLAESSGIPYSTLAASEPNEAPIATSTLRPSSLDKIRDFLVRGERRKAYHYALDEKLWAHAMLIASSLDREAWKEAVNEFLRTELGAKTSVLGADSSQPLTNGREGLRVAYSLYSGQGSASVQELVPQNLLSRAAGRLQLQPPTTHLTPMTPNFAAPALANNIPVQSLAEWAETAAMMLSSPMTSDISAALTALGDQLLSHQWVEAAHACYLLSSQTSSIGGIGNPSARIVLLGSRSPQVWPSFYKDSDPVIFTEILEFALSLAPPNKGQDPFYGLPHLQAYRFIRAISLAELGELQLASRYCEAITTAFGSRGSPYFTGCLLDQLKSLSDRIIGLDRSDKSGFWKGTPSLDTIGRFLEGRFTKLVTGDADPGTPTVDHHKVNDTAAGPFSQYSTISSTTTSASPSPQPSLYNLNSQPMRTGSAMGQQSGLRSQPSIDRASSAMDHVRRRPSPPSHPRVASANASTTTFAQAPSFVQAYNNYSPNPYSPSMATPRPNSETVTSNEEEMGQDGQEVSWWGSSSYANDSANQTPMAATFVQVDSEVTSSSEGFISLMDNATYTVKPAAAKSQADRPKSVEDADEEDDLGFGNSKPKSQTEKEGTVSSAAPAATAPPPERPDAKPALAASSSGSWLGRWWKRSEATTPGPVKANLGEETSFYYDKDLKRWVNKRGGAEEPTPVATPPPPPSRSQTASPGMSGPRVGTSTPPPPRSASVAEVAGPPPGKSSMRVRSNLAPTPETGSEPGSPLRQSTLTPPPPPSRPRSQASKRVRSRYVDVFQQEGGAA